MILQTTPQKEQKSMVSHYRRQGYRVVTSDVPYALKLYKKGEEPIYLNSDGISFWTKEQWDRHEQGS